MAGRKIDGSVRERLLAAADQLFYDEGVHSVGIDRVIEQAGVAKASLYSSFGSKEELVASYLERRAEKRKRLISERLARYHTPREQILGIFELLGEIVADPKYRGCAFVNAAAEAQLSESRGRTVWNELRKWVWGLFCELARELHARRPEELGHQLALLYDGVVVRAAMDRDPRAAADARAVAETLLEHVERADKPRRPSASQSPKRARN
ncbi:MAG TPA: TetR/AcrR family transcriptional regulator [Polyangiaceae bacterium]|nr:TetR/AcrR family transcriptional regulator [Polyangiaceae bacterium]